MKRVLGWYSVRLLIRCTGKGQPRKLPLYEDRIVLIRARSHAQAKAKAREIVSRAESPYKNPLGNMVHWKISNVFESVELFQDEFKNGKPRNGVQVYWRYIRATDPVKKLKREGTMSALF
jgi:hypothetical protein